MEDFVDEILDSEPQMNGVGSEELTEWFDKTYDDVDEVWEDVDNREHQDSSFRLPIYDEKPLSCLGRTLMVAMYNELVEGEEATINVHYDERHDLDGTSKLNRPHVSVEIGDKAYGDGNFNNNESLETEALSDLYKIGLGYKILEEGEEIEGISYNQLADWGEEINENTPKRTDNGFESKYIGIQSYLMAEEAQKEGIAEQMGEDGSEVYIGS